jgi:hypothetical protein
MSNVELFAFGVLVTLLMSAALTPLIWAAIQDGRYNDQQQQLYREEALRVAAAGVPTEPSGVSHGA